MTQKTGATSERTARIEPLTRLATGGMADIWLSREVGAAGLERFVVVKRLLPHLAREPEIVDMFLSEARFVARLVHPNVVQIHDLGEDDEGYFLVMEYVAGCSVSELLTVAAQKRDALPLAASICIAEQACRGAHAAHELCDPSGKPLGLVHRDISPHNLMIGPSGDVKLLDFGIAKATAAAEATRTGSLKGKHGYMSPEQCAVKHLDRRSDVFALGIVTWELLTGARLFKRETEYATMHAIVNGETRPPSTARPDLPAVFDEVLAKALAVDLGARFQTADTFRRALLAAAEESGVRPSRDALVATMTELLGERLDERERALHDAARSGKFPEPSALRAALVQPDRSSSGASARTSDAAATVVQRRGPTIDDEGVGGEDAIEPAGRTKTKTKTRPGSSEREPTVIDTNPSVPRFAEQLAARAGTEAKAVASAGVHDEVTRDEMTREAAVPEGDGVRDEVTRDELSRHDAPHGEGAAREDGAARGESGAEDVPAVTEAAPPWASRRFWIATALAMAVAGGVIRVVLGPDGPPARGSGSGAVVGSSAVSGAASAAPADAGAAAATKPPAGPPLRFVVAPTVDPKVIRSELAPFVGWLQRTLDRPMELSIAESYDDTGERIAKGQADFGLVPPLLFVRLRAREPKVQPLVVRLFDGSRASDGYVLVRDDSKLLKAEDLRDKTICYVDSASTTGFLLPRIWMRKANVIPDKDVRSVISGDHLAAMRDLAAGKCDAAAVYSGAYLTARQEGVAVGQLRVMAITGRVPQDVLVAAPTVSAEDMKALHEALLHFEPRRDIDAGAIGEVLGITGFAEIKDSEFDAIRDAADSEGLLPKPGGGW